MEESKDRGLQIQVNWVKIPPPTGDQVKSQRSYSVKECEDALRDLFLAAQEKGTFTDTTLNRPAGVRDGDT